MTPSPRDAHQAAALLSAKSATACMDAAHLRREAASLRWTTKVLVRESRRQRHVCSLSLARSRLLQAQPMRSPWSPLLWQRAFGQLDQVLVPISADDA